LRCKPLPVAAMVRAPEEVGLRGHS
jgi:hypothetical protein